MSDGKDKVTVQQAAHAVFRLLVTSETLSTVALSSPWGTGKSKVAKEVVRRLEADGHFTFWYDIRLNDSANDPFSAFIAKLVRNLAGALSSWQRLQLQTDTLGKQLYNRRNIVGWLICATVVFAFCNLYLFHHHPFDLTKESTNKGMEGADLHPLAHFVTMAFSLVTGEQLRKSIEKVMPTLWGRFDRLDDLTTSVNDLANKGGVQGARDQILELIKIARKRRGQNKAIFFIDGLDRCSHSDGLEFLELMDGFFADEDSTVIVVLADVSVLEKMSEVRVKNKNLCVEPGDYLDRIVPLRIKLPTFSDEQIRLFTQLPQIEDLQSKLQKYLDINTRPLKNQAVNFVNQLIYRHMLQEARGQHEKNLDN
jgi:hypothetical protein